MNCTRLLVLLSALALPGFAQAKQVKGATPGLAGSINFALGLDPKKIPTWYLMIAS